MDRLIATSSVPFASADTAPATGTPQYATSGNPSTGVAATIFPAYAWNMLQDEIYNVIIAAGLTPNRNAWNQLLTAIEAMLQGGTTNIAVDTGTANTYVVAFTPTLSAPVPWAPFWFKVKTANTGASTLNATGTAQPFVGGAHLALQGGELIANGNALVYWNPTVGSGSYILMFCSGAPEQIAAATQSEHAVQAAQLFGGLKSVVPFTSSGTQVVPALVTAVYASATAAGGGGGGNPTVNSGNIITGSSGGGAGQHVMRQKLTVVPGETLTVTIGAAGAQGGATGLGGNGGTGGTTSIVGSVSGTLLTLTGGTGGFQGIGGAYTGYYAGPVGGPGQPAGNYAGDTGPVGMAAAGGQGAGTPFGAGAPGGRGSLIGGAITMVQGVSATANSGAGGGGCGGTYAGGGTAGFTANANSGGLGGSGFAVLEW